MPQSQKPVSTDGVGVDLHETARQARKKVKHNETDVPVHACGTMTHQDCPCWICTEEHCAACMATIY